MAVDSTICAPQQILNGEVHNWYRIIHGYSDHLVSGLLDRFKLDCRHRVLDPFCGTGTTLVECMKKGVSCAGIEANPAALFATRVKTNWHLNPDLLLEHAATIRATYPRHLEDTESFREDLTVGYLRSTGLLDRGWISSRPLRKSIAIKQAIRKLRTTSPHRNALMLALLSEIVGSASNIKFGPELYCGPQKHDASVLSGFENRVATMAKDLRVVRHTKAARVITLNGDARNCSQLVRDGNAGRFHAVICSPPYPTEHDYTRNTRLELAFLEDVVDLESLRKIKKGMMRSHTKGIYVGDNDGELVANDTTIVRIAEKIRAKTKNKSYGFARLYHRVMEEYFGGMKRHLMSVHAVLRHGAHCAYIVGDQSSYLRVHIPTAEILASLAQEVGFTFIGIERWRGRRSTITSNTVDENILLLGRD